jgi:hypothetical protein
MARLLDHVGQLMCKDSKPVSCSWRIFVRPEHNVVSEGVGAGVKGVCGYGCTVVRVDPDVAEVMAQLRLHDGARTWRQGLSGRFEHAVHDGGHMGRASCSRQALDLTLVLAV